MNYTVDVVKNLAVTRRPGGFLSLFSCIGRVLGLPRCLGTGGGECDSSSSFDDDLDFGLGPGFCFSILARNALYRSR